MNRIWEVITELMLVGLVLAIAYLSTIGAIALAIKWGWYAS